MTSVIVLYMYWPLIDERGIIPVLVDVKTTLFECSETCLKFIILFTLKLV